MFISKNLVASSKRLEVPLLIFLKDFFGRLESKKLVWFNDEKWPEKSVMTKNTSLRVFRQLSIESPILVTLLTLNNVWIMNWLFLVKTLHLNSRCWVILFLIKKLGTLVKTEAFCQHRLDHSFFRIPIFRFDE